MALGAQKKKEVIESFAVNDKDTGSAAVQVALITERLGYLQQHFAKHKHDFHSRRGLLKLVGRRRNLLDYIKRNNVGEYKTLIKRLGIRK